MTVEEAIKLAVCEDYTPSPHEQATVSYVLAKEVERLRQEKEGKDTTRNDTGD